MSIRFRAVNAALLLGFLPCAACDAARGSRGVPVLEVTAVPHVLESDSVLYAILDVWVAENGETWALSAGAPYVYRWNPAGRLTAAWGTAGQGPGELLNPWSVAPAERGDGAVVWDVSARRLVTYDQTGREVTSVPVPLRLPSVRGDIREISYGAPLRMRAYRDGFLIQIPAGAVAQTRDLARSFLVHVSHEGTVLDTIPLEPKTDAPQGGPGAVSLVPVPLWAVCDGERLAILLPDERVLRIREADASFREWRLELPSGELEEEQIRRHLTYLLELESRRAGVQATNVEEAVSSVLARHRGRFGRTVPAAVDMLCESGGRIWLNAFSTVDDPIGYSREWHVISPGSTAVQAIVRMPPGFRLRQLSGDRAVGIVEDADGIQRPAWVPLPDM